MLYFQEILKWFQVLKVKSTVAKSMESTGLLDVTFSKLHENRCSNYCQFVELTHIECSLFLKYINIMDMLLCMKSYCMWKAWRDLCLG